LQGLVEAGETSTSAEIRQKSRLLEESMRDFLSTLEKHQ